MLGLTRMLLSVRLSWCSTMPVSMLQKSSQARSVESCSAAELPCDLSKLADVSVGQGLSQRGIAKFVML